MGDLKGMRMPRYNVGRVRWWEDTSAGCLKGVMMTRYNAGRERWWEATSVEGLKGVRMTPSIEIPPIGPHLLPFTKILGPWWGLQSPFAAM